MPTVILDLLPLWAVYLLIVVVGLLVLQAGFYVGRYWTKRSPDKEKLNLDSSVGSILALLAFLLVFMIGIATNRFDARRALVVAEANAVETTYLRTSFLDEPQRGEVRDLLYEYVTIRLDAAADPSLFTASRTRSEVIHTELWEQAEIVARANPDSEMAALFVTAVNQIIEVHTERAAAVLNRFPRSNWLAILFVTLLALVIAGFNDGLLEERIDGRNVMVQVILILIFGAVVLLLVDLDRTQEGLLQVSQRALVDLQQQMQSSGP